MRNDSVVCLIEYDGEQHYWNVFGDQIFEATQKRDEIKNQYCAQYGIPLYRIPYADFDHIEEIVTDILKRHDLLSETKVTA